MQSYCLDPLNDGQYSKNADLSSFSVELDLDPEVFIYWMNLLKLPASRPLELGLKFFVKCSRKNVELIKHCKPVFI